MRVVGGAMVGVVGALGLGWAGAAAGAEVTDVPEALGLEVGLGYHGRAVSGGLVEGGEIVGQRRISRHDLALEAAFSPIAGLSIGLGFVFTPSYRFAYPEAREMGIEPLTGAGSFLASEPTGETPVVRGSGLDGIWLGVTAAPFSERYTTAQRASWRIDAGIRSPSPKRNLWSAPKGTRGVAEGGVAFKLGGAFSSERGAVEPWLNALWIQETKVSVDVIDEDGVTWAKDVPLRPASTVDIGTGAEFVAFEQPDPAVRVALGPSLTVGYRSWEDVASGVYLPNVLDGARGIPVTTGDTLGARVGLDFAVHAADVIKVSAGAGLSYLLPYRLEHVYPVSTSAETFGFDGGLTVTGVIGFAREQIEPEPME